MATTLGDLREDALIHQFFGSLVPDLSDDTALLQPEPGTALLVSTDALIQDVHFPAATPGGLVAHKAVRANVSDIAASGGQARWLTLSLSLPPELPIAWLQSFSQGLGEALDATRTQLVGGDTTRAPVIAISMTAIGQVLPAQRIGRTGGKPGDLVMVTGALGGAGLGLTQMLRQTPADFSNPWIVRHFMPPFRGAFAQALAASQAVTAMMDLSDGPAVDLPRLCKASGVGAMLYLAQVPVAADILTPLQAVGSGEDFELLLCVPPDRAGRIESLAQAYRTPLHTIGVLTDGHGVQLLDEDGTAQSPPASWSHFQ